MADLGVDKAHVVLRKLAWCQTWGFPGQTHLSRASAADQLSTEKLFEVSSMFLSIILYTGKKS